MTTPQIDWLDDRARNLAPHNDGTYRRLAVAVLIAHQQTETSGCLCGRTRLGDSHAEHVALILDTAGALRDRPPARR